MELFLSIITILYAGTGVFAIAGFLPTMKDIIIAKKNKANANTYFIWICTNLIATIYGIFIMKNWIFSTISGISCLCCGIICISSIILSKRGVQYTPGHND